MNTGEPHTVDGCRFLEIFGDAADRSVAGLFVCEGVRSSFDYVIVLPRDLKNNKEDIPDKMNDRTADCIRYRLRHNTRPTVSLKRRWVA